MAIHNLQSAYKMGAARNLCEKPTGKKERREIAERDRVMRLLRPTRVKIHGIGLDLIHPLGILLNQGNGSGRMANPLAISVTSDYRPQTTHKTTLWPRYLTSE